MNMLGHSLAVPQATLVHYVLETAALMTGGVLYWRAGNAATQPPDRLTRWAILAGAALGAAIGSRFLYGLQYWSTLIHQPMPAWLAGKTIVGGLLGAVVGVELAKRWMRWPHSTGDGFVLPLAAAIFLGRVGCQLSGLSDLTYGSTTLLPWGWDYGDGISRHPTSLYEVLGVLLLIVWINRGRYRLWARGDQFRVFLSGYLILRVFLDMLKPPYGPPAVAMPIPEWWGIGTPIQWACLIGIACYARDLARICRREWSAHG